jgi:hypothetical protein
MTDAELETERLELLAKEQELEEAHGRLHAVPHDMASHRAHRERLKAHQERLRAYHHERIGDSPATVGVTVIDVTPIHDRLIVKRFEHDHAQPATSHGEMF